MKLSLKDRIMDNISLESNDKGCWLWTGATNTKGYGMMSINNIKRGVHRILYEIMIGTIPEGLELDHSCRIRRCVNPKHLEPVTGSTNILRGDSFAGHNAKKTHCPSGHPYNTSNTIIGSNGSRYCRECRNIRNIAWRKRK